MTNDSSSNRKQAIRSDGIDIVRKLKDDLETARKLREETLDEDGDEDTEA